MSGLDTLELSGSSIPGKYDLWYSGGYGAFYNSYYRCWRLHYPGSAYMQFISLVPQPRDVNLVLTLASGAVSGSTNCPITITWNGHTVASGWDPHNMSWYNKFWRIPAHMTIPGYNTIRIQLDGGATTVPFLRRLSVANFYMEHQQMSNWCWAGCGVSVARYYGGGSSGWSQCTIANVEKNRNDCCAVPANCNSYGYLNTTLSTVGHFSHYSSGSQSFGSVVGQLDARRPLGVRTAWSGGGAHFLFVTGAWQESDIWGSTTKYLTLDDPWYGRSTATYDTFKNRYQGSGSWTHSYFTR